MSGLLISRRAAAICCALVLITSMPSMAAHAEDLATQRTRTVAAISAARDRLSTSLQELRNAESGVDLASSRVDEAQATLLIAEAQIMQAQAATARCSEELEQANLALELARAKEAAHQAKVDAQREAVATYARVMYQDNLPMITVAALLGASSPTDLAHRMQWTDMVLESNYVDLTYLRTIQVELAQARAESDAAQIRANEAKQEADAQLLQARNARDGAALAHAALRSALNEQAGALEAAQQAVSKNKATLTDLEAQLRRLDEQIAQGGGTPDTSKPVPTSPAPPSPSPPSTTPPAPPPPKPTTAAPSTPPPPPAPTPTPTPKPTPTPTPTPTANANAQKVVDWAMARIGYDYVWGGEGPTGYDCSGFTMMAYRSVGIYLPHGAGGQFRMGTPVEKKDLKPGDLVFFYEGPGHVGVYVGNGMIVDARNYGVGVVYSSIDVGMPFVGARRYL